MPTQNERKALWFIAIVALSGATVRLIGAGNHRVDATSAEALDRQLARADSARSATAVRRPATPRKSRKASGDARPPAPVIHPPAPERAPGPSSASASVPQVDLDAADSAAIETLPGIGPALAARIVRHRDSAGAFGSLGALCDVRGIGPGLAKRLRPLVTFSAPRRPLSDQCAGASRSTRKSSSARRRDPR